MPCTDVQIWGTPASAGPEDISSRVLLFQAAVAAKQNELALSALKPLVNEQVLAALQPFAPEDDAALEGSAQPDRSFVASVFLTGHQLDMRQEASIAVQMAGALQNLNRLEEAGRLWKAASVLATEDSLRNQADLELKRLEAQVKIEKANQERQPAISEKASTIRRPTLR